MRFIRIITPVLFAFTLIIWVMLCFLTNRDADQTSPVIMSEIDVLQLSVNDDKSKLMDGLTAQDNIDGDLTNEIMIGSQSKFLSPGVYEITYLVFDSSNNVGSYTRKIEYLDYRSPEISMSQPLMFRLGDDMSVLEYLKVLDVIEGDISEKLKIISSNVDPEKEGDYIIGVEAANSYGDKIALNIPVILVSRSSNMAEIELTDYLVYIGKGTKFNPHNYLKEVIFSDGTKGDVEEVVISSNVNTAVPGNYAVKYVYNNESLVNGCTVLTVIVTGGEDGTGY